MNPPIRMMIDNAMRQSNDFKRVNTFVVGIKNTEITMMLHEAKNADIEKSVPQGKFDDMTSLTNGLTLFKTNVMDRDRFLNYAEEKIKDLIDKNRTDFKSSFLNSFLDSSHCGKCKLMFESLDDVSKLIEDIADDKILTIMMSEKEYVSMIGVMYSEKSDSYYLVELTTKFKLPQRLHLTKDELVAYLYNYKDSVREGHCRITDIEQVADYFG